MRPFPRPFKPYTHTQPMAFTIESGNIYTIRELINGARVPQGRRVDGFVRYQVEMLASGTKGAVATLQIDGSSFGPVPYSSPVALSEPLVLFGAESIAIVAIGGDDKPAEFVFSGECFWNWPAVSA